MQLEYKSNNFHTGIWIYKMPCWRLLPNRPRYIFSTKIYPELAVLCNLCFVMNLYYKQHFVYNPLLWTRIYLDVTGHQWINVNCYRSRWIKSTSGREDSEVCEKRFGPNQWLMRTPYVRLVWRVVSLKMWNHKSVWRRTAIRTDGHDLCYVRHKPQKDVSHVHNPWYLPDYFSFVSPSTKYNQHRKL